MIKQRRKNRLLRVTATILLMTGLGNAWAQQSQCAAVNDETTYYFGNGVATTYAEAALSLVVLARTLEADGVYQEGDRFNLAYNQTRGLLVDLVEALVQDLQTTFTQAFRMIFGDTDDENTNFIVRRIAAFNQNLIQNEDLDRHIQQYKSDILSGNKVIVVAHSQGNFFANQAWDALEDHEQLSMGIVSVANPDSTVGPNSCLEASFDEPLVTEFLSCAVSEPSAEFLLCSPDTPVYTTACTDLVIIGLRQLYGSVDGSSTFDFLPRALPSNTEATLSSDPKGHGFVSTYMRSNSATRVSIVNDAVDKKAGLASPTVIGDLEISGTVVDSGSLAPLAGSRVKVELIGSDVFDAVVDGYSDAAGDYSLCVPSDSIPDNFLVSASKDRYVPKVANVLKDGTSAQSVNFELELVTDAVVVIELDPVVHHLGDDNYSGSINSQFQKRSEGLDFGVLFSLSDRQRAATAAQLTLYAKGLQAENPVTFDEEIIGYLNSSPEDGSFTQITIPVPIGLIQTDFELHTIRIESALGGGLFLDRDDFEFSNLILELTLP